MGKKRKQEVIKLNQDDSLEDWDTFVSESSQGSVFSLSWWLRTTLSNKFEISVIKDGDAFKAAFIHSYFRGNTKIIRNPIFSPFQGVLLGKSHRLKYSAYLSDQMDYLRILIQTLPQDGKIDVLCHPNFTNWLPFYWANYKQTTRYTYIVEPLFDEKQLFKNIRSNVRTDVNKAKRKGLIVEESMDFDLFWEVIQKTYFRQDKYPPIRKSYLEKLYRESHARGYGKILTSFDEYRKPYATLFYVWSFGTAYFIISGADPDIRNVGSSSHIYWNGLLDAAKVAERVNFCGSMMPQVETLLRAFGGKQTPYFSISKDNTPFLKKAMHNVSIRAKEIIKKYGKIGHDKQ
ncbi:MAG: GNAT family N-acetyltransferase [Candidatus Hatepunaea meridiana]|nr:GNAT family N-acetyltransferase [Candidatus Hatepunaea meridiana]